MKEKCKILVIYVHYTVCISTTGEAFIYLQLGYAPQSRIFHLFEKNRGKENIIRGIWQNMSSLPTFEVNARHR
jgi:hypothetical protein